MAVSKVKKPSGWKDKGGFGGDKYYTKDTKYGVKYMCKFCGKSNVGIDFSGRHMHWKSCPHYPWKVEVRLVVKKIESERRQRNSQQP